MTYTPHNKQGHALNYKLFQEKKKFFFLENRYHINFFKVINNQACSNNFDLVRLYFLT